MYIWIRKNGIGKDVIGKLSWLSVVVIMKIVINEKVVWFLFIILKDVGKYKGFGNWIYYEVKDLVIG